MKTKKAMFVFLAFITTMPVHAKQSIDPNVEAQIQLMLKHNNQVRLMVLPGKPAHVTTSRENNRAMATVNAFSARLMNQFAKNPNFQLIERVQIEALLGEIHFQYTGAVESNSVQEIGRLSGTTHILIVDVADNYVSRKLVEIKTGRVLAISNDVFKS